MKNLNETINKEIMTFLVIYGQTRIVSECWNEIINFLKSKNIEFEQKEWYSIPANEIEKYLPQFFKLKTEDSFQNKNSEGKSISSGVIECIYPSDLNYAFNKIKDESFFTSLKSNLKKIDTKKVAEGLINIVSNKFFK